MTSLVVCVRSVDIDSLNAAVNVQHISDTLLIKESGKVRFVIALMDNLRAEHHRCLVFCSSARMLDILQKVMQNKVCFFFSFIVDTKAQIPLGPSRCHDLTRRVDFRLI